MKGICLGSDPWPQAARHRRVRVDPSPLRDAGSHLTAVPVSLPQPPSALLSRWGEDKKSPDLSISSSASFSNNFQHYMENKMEKIIIIQCIYLQTIRQPIKTSSARGSPLVEGLILHSHAPKEQTWLHPANIFRMWWHLWQMPLYFEYFTTCYWKTRERRCLEHHAPKRPDQKEVS